MVKIKEVLNYLENIAPPAYQESYDNSGLLVGNVQLEVMGILVSLDCTEDVIKEASKQKCNLIITHHPIIFKGLKSLTGENYVERSILLAIKKDIAIYAIHTNLDNVSTGVNERICKRLGLNNCKILAPKPNSLSKLETFVPPKWTQRVLKALHNAGAGNIGNYSDCSFTVSGRGTFLPTKSSNPRVGQRGKLETVVEDRIELIFPSYRKASILQALLKAHPYEEAAYYLHDLSNFDQNVGSGMVGELPKPVPPRQFLKFLKDRFRLKLVRHTELIKGKISKVAVCGGAGSFLIPKAIAAKADIFITADIKYHEFFDAENKIILADIGHYESEAFTKDLLCELLRKKFSNFAVNLSKTNTNPVNYY